MVDKSDAFSAFRLNIVTSSPLLSSPALCLKQLNDILYDIWRKLESKKNIYIINCRELSGSYLIQMIDMQRQIVTLWTIVWDCTTFPPHLMVKCFEMNHFEVKLAEPLRRLLTSGSCCKSLRSLRCFLSLCHRSFFFGSLSCCHCYHCCYHGDSCALTGLEYK